MKKIINGKLYNTDTAKEIGSWENMDDVRNFSRFEETLYQKRTGEFFLHGVGGAATKYAVSLGNSSWTGGESIIPLSWEAARKWCEEHLSAEEYEAVFGEVTEDDSRTVVTLSISTAALETAKRAAAQAGVSLSGYIEGLIQGKM